jgi:hypothetical protein
MSLPGLRWEWIAGLAALVIVIVIVATRRPRRRTRSSSAHPVAPGSDGGQTGYSDVLRLTGEVRHLLAQHARQMEQLRTTLSSQMQGIGEKVDALAATRTSGGQAGDQRRDAAPDSYAAPPSVDGYGADSLWPPSAAPAWSAGPADQAVEIRDGELVRSRSLPPAAYVSPAGAGRARVYLNADVQMTEISLPKWEVFFDLQGGRTYTAYRTTRPATVRWDEGEGRGELISKGLAEAV